jgi:hypothetical protein
MKGKYNRCSPVETTVAVAAGAESGSDVAVGDKPVTTVAVAVGVTEAVGNSDDVVPVAVGVGVWVWVGVAVAMFVGVGVARPGESYS